MEHKGTKVLETNQLTLRPFVLGDAEAMFRNWASSKEVTKYLTWPTHTDVTVSEQVLKEWVACYQEQNFYQWAIVLKDCQEPIGSIAVVRPIDEKIQSAHIGYCIGDKWWRKGITSEALEAVMQYLFEEVGVKKVDSRHDPKNPNSGAVMKKCGMKYEGTLRMSDWNNQGVCDASYYGMLAHEWRQCNTCMGQGEC